MHLAAARVFVRNLQEARVFYEEKLGLRVGAAGPDVDFVVFEVQSCDLIVERVSIDAPPKEQALVGRVTGLSFNVKNIARLCQQLMSQGVQFSSQPEFQPWGETTATLLDPAGNEIQLVEYPSEFRGGT